MKFKHAWKKKRLDLYKMSVIYLESVEDFAVVCDGSQPDETCGGAARRVGSTIYIYLPHENESADIRDMAHECYHAADFVCDWVGIEYKAFSGNEQVAYLVGWFMDFVLTSLNQIHKARNKK